ncbi:hypothetical protein HBN50_15200 [Halobacteriovorax sp. GB3]|uniref:hypothetical protein n=1 Tax=Halobacteriovorax sp. GB3 TaxID=2719615 RepID=UPI0023612D5C|nr:hypothetical protein [Halobacteriovorax sp. GB3]MDD0854457.1 hypothetical protein [Halobacteriovorax sp. GB3]
MRFLLTLGLVVLVTACSTSSKDKITNSLAVNYKLTDKSGDFYVTRKRFYKEKSNKFVVKKVLLSDSTKTANVLEKSILVSNLGQLKGKDLFRPESSYYEVWFDGKKYVSAMKVNVKEKKLEVILNSPEAQWKGRRSYDFPTNSNVFCFYNQVAECLGYSGFLSEAIKKNHGSMKFKLIWNGYPYFQEQYLNIPEGVFQDAEFSYDGKSEDGNFRFSLKTENHVQFYFFDDDLKLKKYFWVAQALSMIEVE